MPEGATAHCKAAGFSDTTGFWLLLGVQCSAHQDGAPQCIAHVNNADHTTTVQQTLIGGAAVHPALRHNRATFIID